MTHILPELLVSDLAISLDFYCYLCGFRLQALRADGQAARLRREGARLQLRCDPAAPATYPCGRGLVLEIAVADLDTLYRRCADRPQLHQALETESPGWAHCADPTPPPLGASLVPSGEALPCHRRQFMLEDPDGYLLRFVQERP